MLITLKQKEIEAALVLFLESRGINTFRKDVQIDFTAGRKEGGLSAEVNIEDAELLTDSGSQTSTGAQSLSLKTIEGGAVIGGIALVASNTSNEVGPGEANVSANANPTEASEHKPVSLFGG